MRSNESAQLLLILIGVQSIGALFLSDDSTKHLDNDSKNISPDTGVAESGCAVGWLVFGSKCFMFEPRPASFVDNVRLCSQLNASTVSVHSKEENEFVRMLLNERRGNEESRTGGRRSPVRVWLGSEHLAARTNSFLWMDGSPLDFTHWAPENPNCADSDGLCALSMGYDGRWTDIPIVQLALVESHSSSFFSTSSNNNNNNTNVIESIVHSNVSDAISSHHAESDDLPTKGLPSLSSQICQKLLEPNSNSKSTLRSALERERLERQKQNRQITVRLDRSFANLQATIDSLKSWSITTNQSLRRETGLRMREQERLRFLLGNQTQNFGNSLSKITAEQRQLSTQLRALAIVCAALIGALAVAAICACRSYLRLRRTYIHPHAVGALLDLNSQLSVAAAAAVNK